MATLCRYCGSPAASNYCSVCGNSIEPPTVQADTLASVAAAISFDQDAKKRHGHETAVNSQPLPTAKNTLLDGARRDGRIGLIDDDDGLDRLVSALMQKLFGVSELINALKTIHAPLQGIRALVSRGKVALSQAFIAYVEFVTIIPFLLTQMIQPMGRAVGYPLIYEGAAVENAVLFYFLTALSGAVGLALIYLLPKNLFSPSTRNLVIATSIYTSMYASVYEVIANFVKIGLWSLTGSLWLPSIVGHLVLAAILWLQYYVCRRVLSLSWFTTVALLALGLAVGAIQGHALAELGLLRLAEN